MEVILSVPSVLHPTLLSQLREVQPHGLVVEVMGDQQQVVLLAAILKF
jgi:hypothetical protein